MALSFLESELGNAPLTSAKVVILPCPYEATTSYHKGTSEGPKALLEASSQLESYDSELNQDISKVKIHTLPFIKFAKKTKTQELDKIYNSAKKVIALKKWLIIIGGEHTVTVPIIKAFKELASDSIGFIHLDAHFDLRKSYENNPLSHGCVLYQTRKYIKKTLSIGIRAFSSEEAHFAKQNKVPFITDKMLWKNPKAYQKLLVELPKKVYLSIDLDFFSPAEISGVGTPVPGGVLWWQGLDMIKTIFKTKEVVGLDIVELCPKVEKYRSPFIAAMLLHKCIGYKIKNAF